ncbi:MAG: prepilin-type N-terminal cleavage/methylation domain-containing protein [Gemmatimonadota bacterium]|nr:prepilin-type N-terminal cleavage/methylation domain-containing protein [Gemmatimonadota bacterium]
MSNHSGHSKKGFSLIEVIVTMVLLAIAVSSLAGLTHSVSQSSIKVTGAAYRNGVLMHEVNRLIALPYDSVAVGISSYSVTSGPYPHSRVVTVAEPATAVKAVKVVVTPTNPLFKPDTMTFTRTNARTSKVLCTICNDKP